MRNTTLLLSMMMLAPTLASGQAYYDDLYGIPYEPPLASPFPEPVPAYWDEDHAGLDSYEAAPYAGPTMVRLVVATPDGRYRYLLIEGSSGTYQDGTSTRKRKKGEETRGKVNLVDMIHQAFRDKDFRKQARELAQGVGWPVVDLVLWPAGSQGLSLDHFPGSYPMPFGPEGIEPTSEPMRWAGALKIKEARQFIRFWVLWRIAISSQGTNCGHFYSQGDLPTARSAEPAGAFLEGWNAYQAAVRSKASIRVPSSAPAGSSLEVTRVLLAIHKRHGAKGIHQAWMRSNEHGCATFDRFLSHLGEVDPRTNSTIRKLLPAS
jgi:hypothetical protein